ncbi:MAG: hypothetical protein Q8903_11935 [Bacteroidota bacterium]|nr:hypothetical protein [Bacteroidota bacterium]
MLKTILFFACSVLLCTNLHAQTSGDETKIKFELSGFVRADAFLDSRQTISLRDNAVMVVPAAKYSDKNFEDLNATPNLTMIGFNTRFAGKVTGVEAMDAKVTGYFEGEFFGMADTDINGFRLRHAYVKFDWKNTSILFGQYWHPMFCTDIIPSFSYAAPFIPYSRNPQIRITQNLNPNISMSLTAMTERDFTSSGPDAANNPVKSNTFLKNAVLPMMDLQVLCKYEGFLIGASADYKSLRPRLKAQDGTKTTEKINSFAGTIFGKINLAKDFVFKYQGVYGQNIGNLTMAGGYAISGIDSTKFTNTNTASGWAEFCYGSKVAYNLFLGYSKNLGSVDNTNGKYFGFLTNVNDIVRIAPNVSFYFSKVKITTELDYTSASYGNIETNNKSKIIDTYRVENYRLSLSCTYSF